MSPCLILLQKNPNLISGNFVKLASKFRMTKVSYLFILLFLEIVINFPSNDAPVSFFFFKHYDVNIFTLPFYTLEISHSCYWHLISRCSLCSELSSCFPTIA
jgi:hypothetical protein